VIQTAEFFFLCIDLENEVAEGVYGSPLWQGLLAKILTVSKLSTQTIDFKLPEPNYVTR
jgi:hypothetical protein